MRPTILLFAIIFTGCGLSLGHKEVKYSEMVAPPRLYLRGDEIIVKTEKSKDNPSFTLYEILPTFDEGERFILLKGHEALNREPKTEFRVNIQNMKADSASHYKIFWVDPDNKRTELKLEKE